MSNGIKSKSTANTWRITGYKGRNDYDGPADDNTNIEFIFDSRFKKEDVEDIMFYYWGKLYRSVAIKAELLKEDTE
jgi:hypothetical protein